MKKMKKIVIQKIELKEKTNSQIIIGVGILDRIHEFVDFHQYSKVLIITDVNIAKLFLKEIKGAVPISLELVIFPAGEGEKNIQNVQKIWTRLSKTKSDRKTLIINLGGGVICDLGGFAASTYMRGVDFLNIPTTLLSQVDAGIGGKTGINFSLVKNLIGTFSQPKVTIIDIETLSSLPRRELISGFMEVIKHGLVADSRYFLLATKKPLCEFSQKGWQAIIERSCCIKAEIIERDEKEKDVRKILNFGHTIGHAIESLSVGKTSPLSHGEAVAIGMLTEGKISQLCGLISKVEFEKLKNAITSLGLPVKIPEEISVKEILDRIQTDKKNFKSEVRWTLLEGIGHAVINKKVNENIVVDALQQTREILV